MRLQSIADLRHRAWIKANIAIDTLNKLNDIVYEGKASKPNKIDNIPEDINNISLQYIQDGIDVYNLYISEIENKKDCVIKYQEKNKECLNDLTIIQG